MPMPAPVPRRPINPLILRYVRQRFNQNQRALTTVAGFPFYTQLHAVLRTEKVPVTKLMTERLVRLAKAIDFPVNEIFLDGDGSGR